MPGPGKKADYDSDRISEELLNAVVECYSQTDSGGRHPSLKQVAELMKQREIADLNPHKIRKLLITAGEQQNRPIYRSGTADKILVHYRQGKSVDEIMAETNLSRASVLSYLPYTRMVYQTREIRPVHGDGGAETDPDELCRIRKEAVQKLKDEPGTEHLWKAIAAFQEYPFETCKGLQFTYLVKKNRDGSAGGELFVNRKEKSITRSSVELAYKKAVELQQPDENGVPGKVTGPKKLGVFGASYLYPVFVRIGVIDGEL